MAGFPRERLQFTVGRIDIVREKDKENERIHKLGTYLILKQEL